MRVPYILSTTLAISMTTQSVLGLTLTEQYRDVEWIRATWFGNDWVTLTVAVPLLVVTLVSTWSGSIRGQLCWLGVLGYGLYNYAFYLVGAALNAFFLLYVLCFLLSGIALILALSRVDPDHQATRFRSTTPVRAIGGYLIFLALGLTAVWTGMWAAYVFLGRSPPVEPEAFKVVAALDMTMMVPALAAGGLLLWRRHPWGYVIASIAVVQGSLYLLVLSVNSVVLIGRGLGESPGELPLWGTLTTATAVAAVMLFANIEGRQRRS